MSLKIELKPTQLRNDCINKRWAKLAAALLLGALAGPGCGSPPPTPKLMMDMSVPVPMPMEIPPPPPSVRIDSGPMDNDMLSMPNVIFKFTASPQGATTECAFDAAPFAACTAPLEITLLPGDHVFRVRAVRGVDTSAPATRSFRIVMPPRPPASLSIESGNNQRAAVLRPLAQPFVVVVRDTAGAPFAGALVQLSPDQPGTRVTAITPTTGSDGRAIFQIKTGPSPATLAVTASAAGTALSTTFTADVVDDTLSRHGAIFIQDPAGPDMSKLDEISRAAMIIFSWEVCDQPFIQTIKQTNPRARILCYHDPAEIIQKSYPTRAYESSLLADILANYDKSATNSWFVWQPSGTDRACFWCPPLEPLMWLMNISDLDCPVIGGQRYHEYIAAKMVSKLFTKNPYKDSIDGLLVDVGLRDVAWIPNIDVNRNGIADSSETGMSPFTHSINVHWRAGYQKILQTLKAAKPGLQIITNQPNELFATEAVGKQFEGIDDPMHVPGPTTWHYGARASSTADMQEWIESYLRPVGLTSNLLEVLRDINWHETAVAMSALFDESRFLLGKNEVPSGGVSATLLGKPTSGLTRTGSLLVRSFQLATVIYNPSASALSYTLGAKTYTIPSYKGVIIPM